MQMNKATAFAILAFTSSALAQWDSYSYGNEVYAREAEPEFEDDYSLYARDAEFEDEDDSFSHLSTRDLIEEYVSQLSARSKEAQAKLVADTKSADEKKAKNDAAGAKKHGHKAKLAHLHKKKEEHIAKKEHDAAAKLQAQIDALKKQQGALQKDEKKHLANAAQDGKTEAAERKKKNELNASAKKAKDEAAALARRALMEEIYGEYDW